MALSTYNARRDFRRTPEPRGRRVRGRPAVLSYLIQKHAARRLHYDFRLELDGVLLSWAVPKGPSLDPADKRLAMHVEDHPLQYGKFEGTIPKGQYGGGAVMLWDRGSWSPVGDPRAGYRAGHLKFDLQGTKLHGRWALIKMHANKYGGKGESWLLVKDADDHARRGPDSNIVDLEPDSVVSGRTIEEIAAQEGQGKAGRSSRKSPRARTLPRREPSNGKGDREDEDDDPATIAGARSGPLPAMFSPALATLVDNPPGDEGWIHEVKYDGYRILSRLHARDVRMYSRNGKEWADRFPAVSQALKGLDARSAWLDGEVCAIDKEGRSDFQLLQGVLSGTLIVPLIYFVFDLIYLDGYDLRDVVLSERKHLLESLLARSDAAVRYSPHVQGSGAETFQKICRNKWEGIVSKRGDSLYRAGIRTRDWVKSKCTQRQEMVIGGFTDPQGQRSGFGALLLGVHAGGELRYSGKVGTGFDHRTLADLGRRLARIERKTSPFAGLPAGFSSRGVHWVAPGLVAEIKYSERTQEGLLRHPVFMGLRMDKKAAEVVPEEPLRAGTIPSAGSSRRATRSSTEPRDPGVKKDMAGVRLSHADKLFFPETGHTKLGLAHYYESVADWILPHLDGRPLSLLRCPDGWGGECFYQKHAGPGVHASVKRVKVPVSSGTATYFSVASLQALVGLVQWGVIELHPWGSRVPRLERPDRIIFDFDPGEDVPWRYLVEAVLTLRALLEALGLTGFLKTTGGKGLHVVLPIAATLAWPDAKAFTRSIAELFARTFPDRFTATLSKARRRGRIYLDYLRNSEGATAIAPYGIRARKNAPVSTPIAWNELNKDVRYDHFNINTVKERLKKLRQDPWQEFHAVRQTITSDMFAKVGSAQPLAIVSAPNSMRTRRKK